ncbi:MAG: 4'-phosphopantetheinyl transferase superfamily protein [Bryobacteraceae bacterium]
MANVDIWTASLELEENAIQRLSVTLSRDERERAARFAFPHLRTSFIAARGLLRTILSSYAGIPPQDLVFEYSAHGKPALEGRPDVSFNVSHSEQLVVCALTRGCGIGIDIEKVRPMPDLETIARHFFSLMEVESLKRLDPSDCTEAFFQCWTRKEALIKATGEGLSCDLTSFTVSLGPHEPARLVWHRDGFGEAAEWELHSFSPAPGYVGAVALRAQGATMRFHRMNHTAL